MEPDLGDNVKAAMLSTETGIVDAHGLMENLESEILGDLGEEGTEGQGSVVLGTKVVRIDPYYGDSSRFDLFFYDAVAYSPSPSQQVTGPSRDG